MVGLAVIFLVIPTVFVGLRLWAKHLGAKGITWDDYLAFGSLVRPSLIEPWAASRLLTYILT